MVIIFKPAAKKEDISKVKTYVESLGNVKAQQIEGEATTILGLVGDTSAIDIDTVNLLRQRRPYAGTGAVQKANS